MATERLSEQSEYELVNKEQDVRGWRVLDADGAVLGVVTELLIDTDAEHVNLLRLDTGRDVAARDVTIGDREVRLVPPAGTKATAQTTLRVPIPEHTESAETAESVRLPVIQQELRVGKREVLRGGVRVHTRVEEHPVEEQVTLREERVVVERRPMDLLVTDHFIDQLSKTPVDIVTQAEVPVVGKEARVVEEVLVRKDVDAHVETIRDTLQRTDVDVEQLPDRVRTDTAPKT